MKKEGDKSRLLLPFPLSEKQLIISGEHDLVNRAVIDKLDSEVIVLDNEMRVILMNAAAEDRLGVKFEEIEGISYFSLRFKIANRNLLSGFESVIKDRKVFNIKEFQYISPNEGRRLIDLSYMPLLDRDDTVRGIISIGKDSILDGHLLAEKSTADSFWKGKLEDLENSNEKYSDQVKALTSQLSKKESEVKYLRQKLGERHSFYSMIGKSYLMQRVYDVIERVSSVDSTVLILGETGTGKELAASAVHYNGRRKNADFIAVNCAALPETLLESELFGSVKGAFTGSVQDRKGKFELADKGTLFLDEVGEISVSTQVKLLRAIQTKEIERIGDERKRKVDIRIIAATNQNLEELVAKGLFRKDLYYRLNIIYIKLPSLRDRREDIPMLVSSFIEKFNERFSKKTLGISPHAMNSLMMYSWPGNVRELEGVIERAMIMSDSEVIDSVDVPESPQKNLLMLPDHTGPLKSYAEILDFMASYEREYLISVFKNFNGKIGDIAAFTKLSRRTILNKMKKFNIQKTEFQGMHKARGEE